MHFHAPALSDHGLSRGILSVDMPKIAFHDFAFHKNIEKLPAFHSVVHRRIMEKSSQFSPQLFRLRYGSKKSACFSVYNFFIFFSFGIVEPSAGAAQSSVPYLISTVMKDLQAVEAVLHKERIHFVPGSPPIIVVPF